MAPPREPLAAETGFSASSTATYFAASKDPATSYMSDDHKLCQETEGVIDDIHINEPHYSKPLRSVPFVTWEQVEERTAAGEMLIVAYDKVYKIDKWAKCHPGGDIVLKHFAGKDATDEARSYHPDWVFTDLMTKFLVARISPKSSRQRLSETKMRFDKGETQFDHNEITRDYRRLEQKMRDTGMYDTNYMDYLPEVVRYLLFAFGMIYFMFLATPAPTWLGVAASAFCTGLLWQQVAFAAHDAGHSGITHDRKIDHLIGIFLGDAVGGLSAGWWKSSHNVHHALPNHPEHDPDIQHLPFYAIDTVFFKNVYSTYYERVLTFDTFSKIMISIQHITYYPILMFGRMNMYRLGFLHLADTSRTTLFRGVEIAGMVTFWIWFSYMLSFLPTWSMRLGFVAMSHTVSAILHVQITLSHFAMPVDATDADECFAVRQLRTTMDVDCPTWLDWFHGGLQYQLPHHLYPRAPRHKLKQLRKMVEDEICAKHPGLKVAVFTFLDGNKFVLNSMKQVAEQVKYIGTEMLRHRSKFVPTAGPPTKSNE
ncbi:delta-6 fatty acid desaturase [Ramicandelaber brevisporus]|nr:delta-6 fatty acid desaturase [Ramicandelaber brevisporus]